MRRRLLALALPLAILMTTGCWDASSPEEMAYVAALGVDKGTGTNLRFTFQIMVPRAIGGGKAQAGGQKEPGQNFIVFTVEAPDVISAIEVSDAFVAKRVTLQHAKVLVLGEDVVEGGIARFTAPAIRHRDFRRTVFVLVSRGSAKEFLELAKPPTEADPALWYEMMMHWQQQTNLVPPIRLHELVVMMERPGRGARAALVAPRPDLKDDSDQVHGGSSPERAPAISPSRFFAGGLPRSREIPVEFLGTACFKGESLVGQLTGSETRTVALIRGELGRRTPFTVPDPTSPDQPAVLFARTQGRPKMAVSRSGSRVSVNFQIMMEGDIGSITSVHDFTTPEGIQRLEKATEKFLADSAEKVLKLTLNEWGIDMYDIADQLRPTFPTLQDWLAFRWSDHVKETRATVNVSFKIRRHGLQKKPAYPAE